MDFVCFIFMNYLWVIETSILCVLVLYYTLHIGLIYKITFWKRELWLAKRCVSVSFTPLYAIAYAIAYFITNSMENLRFDKEGYFHVLVFYGLFYQSNRKHFFLVFPLRYRNTRGSLEELEIAWSSRSPKLPLVFL